MKKIACLIAGLMSATANAAIISYTDRTSFDAAAGATTIENFESFAVESAFHTSPLDVGDFSLSMTGSPRTDFNFIDIPPAQASETDVNGTNGMRVLTSNTVDLVFTFDSAITAFGADFMSLNDVINRTDVGVDGQTLSIPIASSSGLPSFFGFTSDTAFTTVTFHGLVNDAYGVDNVTYTTTDESPVSTTGTLALLGLGLAGLGISRRKSKTDKAA